MSKPIFYLDPAKKEGLDNGFAAVFGRSPECYFLCAGSYRNGGNHTEHQSGRVLAVGQEAIADK